MEFSPQTLILLPIGLGLLGFVEPCTIGGHLLFLDTQKNRTAREKFNAVAIFIAVRSLVCGMFGALIAFVGQHLIELQRDLWLVFGLIYLTIGLAYLIGQLGILKTPINLAPRVWRRARNPAILGLAFGLNIPACAAPILFGLLAMAATTGTVFAGFAMMFLFGLFLSLPLAVFATIPKLAAKLDKLTHWLAQAGWMIGIVFTALGIWSIWFWLTVDPADWAMQ